MEMGIEFAVQTALLVRVICFYVILYQGDLGQFFFYKFNSRPFIFYNHFILFMYCSVLPGQVTEPLQDQLKDKQLHPFTLRVNLA